MKGGRSKAEAPKKADNKLAAKRKLSERASSKPAKREKGGKDPNKPKRPASAFFVFMEDFRKEFKEKNPNNKQVSAVSKAGGDKWKLMSDAEKAPYVAKAAKRKTEYTKNMDAYNKGQLDGQGKDADDEEEGSDKSKSEVNDEDDDDEEGSGEDDDDEE